MSGQDPTRARLRATAERLERALEASLGYYIFPLVAVMLGAVVLDEHLAPLDFAGFALIAAALLVLRGK